jgi:hypothetical protein
MYRANKDERVVLCGRVCALLNTAPTIVQALCLSSWRSWVSHTPFSDRHPHGQTDRRGYRRHHFVILHINGTVFSRQTPTFPPSGSPERLLGQIFVVDRRSRVNIIADAVKPLGSSLETQESEKRLATNSNKQASAWQEYATSAMQGLLPRKSIHSFRNLLSCTQHQHNNNTPS